MNKQQMIEGPSCLTKAEDNEPLFVLRANDELAPTIVRFWACRYVSQKKAQNNGELTDAQNKKAMEAFKLADEMELWKINKKLL